MKISVLICTRDRPQDIVWCLPAALACDYPDYEVVLVDQSDGKETAEIAARHRKSHAKFVYIPTETRGHDLALNLGVRACSGEIIACTDDDCEMQPGWVAQVAKIYQDDPTLDIVFGQVHVPSDLPSPDLAVPSLYFKQRRELARGQIFGMGANMTFRRDLFDRINGFDDILGPGAPLACSGDFDFLYRAQLLGAKAVADPSLMLVHRAYRTQEQWDRVTYLYGMGDAAFYSKHARCGDPWAVAKLVTKLILGAVRRIIAPLLGKNPQTSYFSGLRAGIAKSRSFRIDRLHRMYIGAPPTAANRAA